MCTMILKETLSYFTANKGIVFCTVCSMQLKHLIGLNSVSCFVLWLEEDYHLLC